MFKSSILNLYSYQIQKSFKAYTFLNNNTYYVFVTIFTNFVLNFIKVNNQIKYMLTKQLL